MSGKLYHVLHETVYYYESTVSMSQHLLHLTPRDFEYQHVLEHDLEITPAATECERYEDWFGNGTTWMALRRPHDDLRLIAASTVEVLPRPPAWRQASGPAWERVAEALARFPSREPLAAQECVMPSVHVPLLDPLRQWALASFAPGCGILTATRHLMRRIHAEFAFDPDASTVATPVAETFKRRRGVCQDFAHVMISALRSLGLAARYMSGYILTTPPPGKPRLIGADASHAWVSLWCPEVGWVGFDPTNNIQPELEHVVLGWGRDFADVSPMRGVILGGASHEVQVRVTVMPAELKDMNSLRRAIRDTPVERPERV